jgi:hypothetical protein
VKRWRLMGCAVATGTGPVGGLLVQLSTSTTSEHWTGPFCGRDKVPSRTLIDILSRAYSYIASDIVSARLMHTDTGPLYYRQIVHSDPSGNAVASTFEVAIVNNCPALLLERVRATSVPLDEVLSLHGRRWSSALIEPESFTGTVDESAQPFTSFDCSTALAHVTRVLRAAVTTRRDRAPVVVGVVINEIPVADDTLHHDLYDLRP